MECSRCVTAYKYLHRVTLIYYIWALFLICLRYCNIRSICGRMHICPYMIRVYNIYLNIYWCVCCHISLDDVTCSDGIFKKGPIYITGSQWQPIYIWALFLICQRYCNIRSICRRTHICPYMVRVYNIYLNIYWCVCCHISLDDVTCSDGILKKGPICQYIRWVLLKSGLTITTTQLLNTFFS